VFRKTLNPAAIHSLSCIGREEKKIPIQKGKKEEKGKIIIEDTPRPALPGGNDVTVLRCIFFLIISPFKPSPREGGKGEKGRGGEGGGKEEGGRQRKSPQ